ncbi:uncharacterized protein V1513DRAFT_454747 [Lipomyces chichibuensis]|uniref:uncharacterized protein n=1 Tax=Lipomyces chichibuensis TaxID=1546026 RepID=UPI00334358D2
MSPVLAAFARLRTGHCLDSSASMSLAAISGCASPPLISRPPTLSPKLEPLATLGLIALVILSSLTPVNAVNSLLPNLTGNSTMESNVTAITNSTSNSTLPSNSSSTTPETFMQNLGGFSKPNAVVNFYFIFLILLAVIGYFAFRYFRKRSRARRVRAVHARRTQALRQDIEIATGSTRRGSHYPFADDPDENHQQMSQAHPTFRSIFGNGTWRSSSSSPLPPPPYAPANGDTSRPDIAYLGGAPLPIYEDIILEEEEEEDEDGNNISRGRAPNSIPEGLIYFNNRESDNTVVDGDRLVRRRGTESSDSSSQHTTESTSTSGSEAASNERGSREIMRIIR